MKKMTFFVMALLVALISGCASMTASAPAVMKDGMMVNAKGMTLYTFDRDVAASGKSVCNGDCAVKRSGLICLNRIPRILSGKPERTG